MQVRATASDGIYQDIRERILNLEFKPGEEIRILDLSEDYGVSRSPVRDALMRLSSESLVTVLPQRGCWISKIDMKRVEEERFLRYSLEKSVLSYFIDRAQKSDIARLEYFLSLQKEAREKNDEIAFFKNDDEMHKAIFIAADMERIWNIISTETGHYRRMRLLSFDEFGVLDVNIRQHEELIKALGDKDLAASLKVESEHIFKLTMEAGDIRKNNPTYFD